MTHSSSAYHTLRLGLATTFIWVGVLILLDPVSWLGYMPAFIATQPFATTLTVLAGGFDILLGFLFVINKFVAIAGILAGLHMLGILIFSGIDSITVRDIGLMAACFALFFLAQERKKSTPQTSITPPTP